MTVLRTRFGDVDGHGNGKYELSHDFVKWLSFFFTTFFQKSNFFANSNVFFLLGRWEQGREGWPNQRKGEYALCCT